VGEASLTHFAMMVPEHMRCFVERVRQVLLLERVDLDTGARPLLDLFAADYERASSEVPSPACMALARCLSERAMPDFDPILSVDAWQAELGMILTAGFTPADFEAARTDLQKQSKRLVERGDEVVARALAIRFWEGAYRRNAAYRQLNFDASLDTIEHDKSRLFELYRGLRAHETDSVMLGSGTSDLCTTSLLFFAKEGDATGFHLDWADACNVAFGIGGRTQRVAEPVSTWYLLHPSAFEAAMVHIEEVGQGRFFGRGHGELDEGAFVELGASLPEGALLVIQQCAGDLISVPPGWMHAVFSTQPCVKLAWDSASESKIVSYALNWRDRLCRMRGENAQDYVALMSLLVQCVLSPSWQVE